MDREDWLAQVDEPVLEPELSICDAHHHMWDRMAVEWKDRLQELAFN